MQHISELTTQRPQGSPELVQPEPQPERVMDKLWMRMAKIYGHRWTASFGDSDDGTWAKGLRGLTGEQIALGLSRCVERGEAWPPTLPEFRALCTPSLADLGLPSVRDAYRDAVFRTPKFGETERPWLHPAVRVAAHEAGIFELHHLPESKSFPIFERAYEVVCRRVVAGEVFDAPVPKAIPEIPKPADPATVSASIAAMRSALSRSDAPCDVEVS